MDLKMIRPKKEDYIIQYNFSYGAWKEFDNEAYQEALEKYVDQLEKAFDKACGELAHAYPCGVIRCGTTWHPDSWKEWCMKDDE